MQGYLGQAPGGFPEPLRSRILKGAATVEGRPGAVMPPLNLDALRRQLEVRFGEHISDRDVLSSAMYPKVFDEYQEYRSEYGNKVTYLPTRTFLAPMEEDEEITVHLAKGSDISIKYKAKGELQPNGKREVFFETQGVPRVVAIEDKRADLGARIIREKADLSTTGSVGAPMSGDVLQVRASDFVFKIKVDVFWTL